MRRRSDLSVLVLGGLAGATGCFSDPELFDPGETDTTSSSGGEASSSQDSGSTAASGGSESGGEETSGETSTDGTTGPADDSGSTEAADESSTGEPGDDNLLINGSFESWAGGVPVSWLATEGVGLAMHDDAYEGESAVQMQLTGYGELRQAVNVPDGLPSGTVVAVEMAYTWLDGATAQPGVDVYGIREGGEQVLIPAIFTPPITPGEWTMGGGNVTTDEDFVGVAVSLVAGGEGAQTVAIDDVRVYVVP